MILLRKIALIFFDLFDKYYHQKKINYFLKKNKMKINFFMDIGAHLGTYTDLILKNNANSKALIFEPQNDIYRILKSRFRKKKILQYSIVQFRIRLVSGNCM